MPDTKTEKKSREAEMAERFARDTAKHELTVVHDDGLYRHLKAKRPDTGMYWFEVVTWPGHLTVSGDCGTFTFARLEDMFRFFRSEGGGINPQYWAEKVANLGKGTRRYSEEVLREHLDEALRDYEETYPERFHDFEIRKNTFSALHSSQRWPSTTQRAPKAPATVAELRELIAEHELLDGLSHEENARELLRELEKREVFSDTWEWSLSDFDWQYLWCCHAIVWAIAKYDGRPTPTPAPATKAKPAPEAVTVNVKGDLL